MIYGQASIERGFHEKNVVLKQNKKDETVAARPFTKNYISNNNHLFQTVSITQTLFKSFRSTYGRYKQDLQDKKENEKKKKKNEELQQLENELKPLNTQCNYLEETISSLDSKFVEQGKKRQKKRVK